MSCWHSIIPHGLWYQNVTSGRAFGNGVYLAKEAQTLMAHYAAGGSRVLEEEQAWADELRRPRGDTEWIMCRHLLIKGLEAPAMDSSKGKKKSVVPLVKLDPAQTITLMSKALQEYDKTDTFIFEERKQAPAAAEVIDISDDEPMPPPLPSKGKGKGSSFIATVSLALKELRSRRQQQRAWEGPTEGRLEAQCGLRAAHVRAPHAAAVLIEQDKAMTSPGGLKELGWNVNSLIFEIRFPSTYLIGPPFFRIIAPRFLPFIHGGSSHITGGGSICMDLLMSDGWLPGCSISAVLMQIKLAISNGRRDWHPIGIRHPYPVSELLVGFKRAAATHGWTVPEGMRYFSLQLRNSSSIMTFVAPLPPRSLPEPFHLLLVQLL
ncbi:hypothetical protein B0H14DRAFT_3459276 [Mycena olivaceomarginata]|nr:hypothetical protein B0H14DRAFT_3459276 [Mycena olivaceomarginata]